MNQFREAFDVSPKVKEHFTNSRIEFLKAIRAVIDGRIEVAFTLDGRLDDPGFSLNENFATKLGGSLAEVLGVSLGGVVEGMSNVIKGLFGR